MVEHTAAELTRQGIDAAKAGDRELARDLLTRAVELDEGQVDGWLWLSGVVDSLVDREVCLENVLALDPGNEAARKGLDWVRAQMAPPAQKVPRVAHEPRAPVPPEPLWEEPPNPFRCPYCAALTEERDRRCPSCEHDLWLRVRRREEHSLWLWNLMVVRASMTVFYAVLPLVALTAVSFRLTETFEPLMLVPVYLGLRSGVPADLAQAALEMLPRRYLLLPVFLVIYSALQLVGMYLRWHPVFYVMLAGIAVRFAGAVVAAVLGSYYGLVCGGFGVVIGLVAFMMVIRAQDDFAWDNERLTLQLDRKSTGGAARLERARTFAHQEMWALCVLYLRAAAAKMPGQAAVHARLAHAYTRLGRHDLARQALLRAQEIDPRDPRVTELVALLERTS